MLFVSNASSEILEIDIPRCLKKYLRKCGVQNGRVGSKADSFLIAYVDNPLFSDYFIAHNADDVDFLVKEVNKEGISTIEWFFLSYEDGNKHVQAVVKVAKCLCEE